MAMLSECMKEKIEILTSPATLTQPWISWEDEPTGKRAVQPGYRADCGAGQCRERYNHRCHRKQSRNIGRLLVVSTSTT
jgi:hypothetical protein